MGIETAISWTNHTFNPWWGCTKVSDGCDNCYAEGLDKRIGGDHWGPGKPRREFGEKHWNEPLKWNELARAAGRPSLVFCASMADIMDGEAPFGARKRLWELIDRTPQLIWQLLTKRPQFYKMRLPEVFKHGNVWLGATAEDQPNYDLRWPILNEIATKMGLLSWISYEPAIGPLTIDRARFDHAPRWIICGGESGGGEVRREFDQAWAENLLAECQLIGTKFFMKQMSAITAPAGKKLVPAHLRIEEFPGEYVAACTSPTMLLGKVEKSALLSEEVG